jgi:DHA1 family bicyclomycin/chloramphenicol resistance-like MFS transporter
MASTAPPLPASPAATTTRMPAGLIVVMLALAMGLQPVTTDLYLPALPALTADLGASMAQAQLTLAALLLAFGVSQLVWGPLSDRFGRKPVLLAGLSCYVVAALGGALAPNIDVLVLWRTVQGAALGASVMCARAIVRDLYAPTQGARVMSRALTGLGVIACLSPPLGGLASELAGWRAALLLVGVFGAATLALMVLRFEETLAHKNPRALRLGVMAGNWLRIARNPTFLSFALLATASYGGLFTFLASSSFVFINVLGHSRGVYGLLMFSMAFAYLLGTVLCRRLLVRFGLRRTVAFAGALSLAGGLSLGGLAWAGLHNAWAIMLPFYLFMLAHGMHQPCGQSGAIAPFPQAAGAASALAGFLMMLVAFAMGKWLGAHMNGTVLPLTNGICFWSVVVSLIAWVGVQRYGEPAAP